MKKGDQAALADLFSCHYPDLYHYGLKILNLPDLIDDSIQDVFIRIWEKRGTLGEVLNPQAYLISCLRRKLFENKEKYFGQDFSDKTDIETQAAFRFEPAEFMEVEETTEQLRQSMIRAINRLPERQRELILLRFYNNLPYREIARIMNINEQSVKNLMQRALTHLRLHTNREVQEGVDSLKDLSLTLFVFFRKKN
ncbi:MAG: RNA polymerase sigma factor [Mangrovibacterium sp.]